MKNVLILLGGNKLNYGIYDKCHRRGFLVYVVDWNDNPFIKGDKHYQVDVKDSEKVLYELRKDGVLDKTLFAYTSIDKAVDTVVDINSEVGCETPSKKALSNVASKSKMTKIWDENGLLNRFSKSCEFYTKDIISINNKTDLIIKPDDSASSRGITVVKRGASELVLKKAYERAKIESTNGIVVIEEYIEGTEYTAELLGDKFGNVSVMAISEKVHTSHAGNNRISVKLHYNCVSDRISQAIANAAIDCYRTLGLSCSMGHLELIVKNDGIVSPIEIGARSSGYIASSLVDIVSGKNYMGKLYSIMNGDKVENGFVQQTDMSSVFYFYDFPQGHRIKKECSILDFMDESITSLYSDRSRIKVGEEFGIIKSDNDRHGYEILKGPQYMLTPKYLRECEVVFLENVL